MNISGKMTVILRLKKNKKNCIPTNFLGESNTRKLDIMIDVVENERDEDWIHDNLSNDSDVEAAMSIIEFQLGKVQLEDILYPEK